MANYMFETDILNKIIKEHLAAVRNSIQSNKYFVSQRQYDAIISIKDAGLKKSLLEIFTPLPQESLPEVELFESILDDKEKKAANAQEALIIGTCIANKYTLVAENKTIAETAWNYGARVNNLYEFFKAIK